MKDSLKSLIRHLLTALAALGTYLASASMIPADQAADVNAAGAALTDPLTLILTALAVALVRAIISFFPWLEKNGGYLPLWLVLCMAGVFSFLPSCSTAQLDAVKQTPVKACYIDEHGNSVCYSTQDGLSATVDRRSGK